MTSIPWSEWAWLFAKHRAFAMRKSGTYIHIYIYVHTVYAYKCLNIIYAYKYIYICATYGSSQFLRFYQVIPVSNPKDPSVNTIDYTNHPQVRGYNLAMSFLWTFARFPYMTPGITSKLQLTIAIVHDTTSLSLTQFKRVLPWAFPAPGE